MQIQTRFHDDEKHQFKYLKAVVYLNMTLVWLLITQIQNQI